MLYTDFYIIKMASSLEPHEPNTAVKYMYLYIPNSLSIVLVYTLASSNNGSDLIISIYH